MTEFHFEHDFTRAESPAIIFEAYFDPAVSAEQDRRVEVARRDVLELEDTGGVLRRVCKVVPRRQLPAVVRPFVPDGLSYTETAIWRRADDLIEMLIEPAVLGGRVEISATYRVAAAGPGVCRRTYDGRVNVQLALLGGRIERAIIEDLGRTLQKAAACTQEWLDGRP